MTTPLTGDPPCVTERRRVGHSEVEVTRLGLGTAPLGGLFRRVEAEDASAVVARALDAGLAYVDTAPLYGHGLAERRLGEVLRDVPRDRFTLSTKVGRLIHDSPGEPDPVYVEVSGTHVEFDFSADGVRRSLEASLTRLGLDRVDIAYVHDPDDYEEQALREAFPALRALREEGVLGAIGVGMNQSRVPTRFVRETDCDVVLLAGRYTVLDQSGAADLLPAAAERGVSVIAGGVFNSGILADPQPGSTYDYAAAPTSRITQARQLADVCARHDVPLTALALQFPLAHPAVTAVLTGVRTVAELDENLARAGHRIPAALWADLVAEGLLDATTVRGLADPWETGA
ncbi:MAG: aldo/keto reductase [Actinomycetes bacterium]